MEYQITKEQREEFETNGFFIIKNALSEEEVNQYSSIVEKIHLDNAKTKDHRLLVRDIFGYSPSFLKLINHPKVFPKIWGILGSNISLYHTHLIVTPPGKRPEPYVFNPKHTSGWHQDGQYMNIDIQFPNRPRLSMKSAFYFTDCDKAGMGNMIVIPGDFSDEYPTEERIQKAIPVLINKGDSIVFDRRLWHTAGMNFSKTTRKVAFFGYAYRWITPADDSNYEKFYDGSDPIVKQLLRYKNRPQGFHNPYLPEDCPLRQSIL